jgi:hypothetical protein
MLVQLLFDVVWPSSTALHRMAPTSGARREAGSAMVIARSCAVSRIPTRQQPSVVEAASPERASPKMSGFSSRACLQGVFIAYLVITLVAVLANGYAACLNFVGAESVKLAADRVGVSYRWMVPFGVLLAMGAGGLLVGLAVPGVGVAAAVGLVLYFICALGAHLRVHDHGIGAAVTFLALAVAALAAAVAYHQSG